MFVISQLGRGTSNRDGASLAWAISEKVALAPETYCLFSTHYLHLSNLKNMYPSHVKLLQVTVEQLPNRLIYLHKIEGMPDTFQASRRADFYLLYLRRSMFPVYLHDRLSCFDGWAARFHLQHRYSTIFNS